MKIYLQEPTVPGRRGIFRAEVIADDGVGDYGLGYRYGWGHTPIEAEECAEFYGFVAGDLPFRGDDARLADACDDFYDGLVPNRRFIPRVRWGG